MPLRGTHHLFTIRYYFLPAFCRARRNSARLRAAQRRFYSSSIWMRTPCARRRLCSRDTSIAAKSLPSAAAVPAASPETAQTGMTRVTFHRSSAAERQRPAVRRFARTDDRACQVTDHSYRLDHWLPYGATKMRPCGRIFYPNSRYIVSGMVKKLRTVLMKTPEDARSGSRP